MNNGGLYSGYSPLAKMNLNNMMEPLAEMEGGGFEPQTRARSNTWPLPRPENFVDPEAAAAAAAGGGGGGAAAAATGVVEGGGNKCPVPVPVSGLPTKKNSSRRNAWGNLSYADLITQAITTSPDKRLTLSQIYEWMVQNVAYFKDKGDSNSSAGWKNSIRHNLSLHNRFMRVQNEGTGKSSWWMINPDAKPGKSPRRRAVSMETSKFEKRRGRVKKKVEMMRNGTMPDQPPSPSSSVSESLDLFPESPTIHSGGGFQLSPDFRPRTSSQSSARLSPIPSLETEWGAATFNGTTFNSSELINGTASGSNGAGNYSPDQLAGNLEQRMKFEEQPGSSYLGYMNGRTTQQGQPPPPYTSSLFSDTTSFTSREYPSLNATSPYATSTYATVCPIHRMPSCPCMETTCIKVEKMSPTSMSPTYPHSEPSPDPLSQQFMEARMPPRPPSSSPPLTPQSQGTPSTMMGQYIGALNVGEDLNIHVDSLPGGFDCNVEDIIQQELNAEGCLDFNFGGQQQMVQQQTEASLASSQSAPTSAYSQAVVTSPSWVH
ncbi:forkhead box protein O-like isoform X2 [Anthonomus grandis grandis]|uniref:forkhead box protein O-like isoform X2 n=1 Tax=Anthonomus grandis grandis TaxID=2921223 RepID=UPI0021669FDC|nr:forkhead box protein O-like isoform X2 [Anthonomus grandis grandis]